MLFKGSKRFSGKVHSKNASEVQNQLEKSFMVSRKIVNSKVDREFVAPLTLCRLVSV